MLKQPGCLSHRLQRPRCAHPSREPSLGSLPRIEELAREDLLCAVWGVCRVHVCALTFKNPLTLDSSVGLSPPLP